MKSKSFDLKRSSTEKVKPNKSFDFTSYYKSAAETKTAVENTKGQTENIISESKFLGHKKASPSKPDRIGNKKKNKRELLDISHIDVEGPISDTSVARSSPLNQSKLTSTPVSGKGEAKVKSIMKNKSIADSSDYLDGSSYSLSKPKKRNKSVSFMLDDAEEVVVKKTKSNESIEKKPESGKKTKELNTIKKVKNVQKNILGKENKRNDNVTSAITPTVNSKKSEKNIVKDDKVEKVSDPPKEFPAANKEVKVAVKKNKFKRLKKQNSEEALEVACESNNNEDQAENKNRKAKKKKHSNKAQQNTDSVEAEGEPAAKAQKKEDKPEAIAEDLESLSIGDNAHTLTNLLDEMAVVDKNKKKKNKQKVIKKEKKVTPVTHTSESVDVVETMEEGKEKIKWKKRKWNKDKKGEADDDVVATSIVIDNLPLSMVCSYKKQLSEMFEKHGSIKKIGVAEVYPTEESKPVFTTTIQFDTEVAALEALKEDQCVMEGSRLRVRPALPATQTTLVLRSYAALSDQSVSSTFAAAGRIRTIRHLTKGKKAIGTTFVEFDGPESLQRALELGAAARVDGKRVHAARFEPRKRSAPVAALVDSRWPLRKKRKPLAHARVVDKTA